MESKTFVWKSRGQCWYHQSKPLGGRMALGMQVRTFWVQSFPHPQQLLTRMELKLGSGDSFPQEHTEHSPKLELGWAGNDGLAPACLWQLPLGWDPQLLAVPQPQKTMADETLPCPDPCGARDVSRGAGTPLWESPEPCWSPGREQGSSSADSSS